MNHNYIPFDFEILDYWRSNGVEQLLAVPFDCIEAREYGDNMPFLLKPKSAAEQGSVYKLASEEVSEFAYNESEGLIFLVLESDLYVSVVVDEKKSRWLGSPWRHLQTLPLLALLYHPLSLIKATV